MSVEDFRAHIEAVVDDRLVHRTLDDVSRTRSEANAERTLQREYFGRFLIELMQNARDAWAKEATSGEPAALHIVVEEPLALTVYNRGTPIPPDIILYSLGRIGESPKERGETIGHKGIGFKAVLELTLSPEVYSYGDGSGEFSLRVRFDPERALARVRSRSPEFDALQDQLPSTSRDPLAVVPVLAFPEWIEDPPICAARPDGDFDTAVRLPFDERWESVLSLSRSEWLKRVEAAITGLSDAMLLLLGTFTEVVVEDHPHGRVDKIECSRSAPVEMPTGGLVERATVRRNGRTTSEWLLYGRNLEGTPGLEGEIRVGIQVHTTSYGQLALAPLDSSDGQCFHLYFPTEILTGTPFLLHAYFEVDASRKSFASDSEPRNRQLLDELVRLTADAVGDLAERHVAGDLDVSPLAGLLAACAEPSDRLARSFHEKLLAELDCVAWVPSYGEHRQVAAPRDLLAEDRANLPALLPRAFPPDYLARQSNLRYPSRRLGVEGLRYLRARWELGVGSSAAGGPLTDVLPNLLRPGEAIIWPTDPDGGFGALAEVLAFLLQEERSTTSELLRELAGDGQARMIPVVDPLHQRVMRSPPRFRSESARDRPILSRVSRARADDLAPPRELDLDFIGDEVLSDELRSTVGQRLGIVEYQTNTVLDRLASVDWTGLQEPLAISEFVWRLLLREERSEYAVVDVLQSLGECEPGAWYWCKPRVRGEPRNESQRRDRALTQLRVRARSGALCPAGELVLGSEWAEWIEALVLGESEAFLERAARYRLLGAIAPSADQVVAPPDVLQRDFPLVASDTSWMNSDEPVRYLGEDPSPMDRHRLLLLAFLLRLGVWEIPPLVSIRDYSNRASDRRDAWSGLPHREEHLKELQQSGALRFHRDYEHANWLVGEDHRLAWSLSSEPDVLRGIEGGAEFYSRYARIGLICYSCPGGHQKTPDDNLDVTWPAAPSTLVRQLRTTPWLQPLVDGALQEPIPPTLVWWDADTPTGSHLKTSWQRYLPTASRLSEAMADLVGLCRLKTASSEQVESLLQQLRADFESGRWPVADGGVTGQAFVSLHQRLYRRLADHPDAPDVLTRSGVLCERGHRLVYAELDDVWFDDRRFEAQLGQFAERLSLVALPPDTQLDLVNRLGIRRVELELRLRRGAGSVEEDVTYEVEPFVHRRAPELLALLVFHPLSGPALDPGSVQFRERALRLQNLRVVRMENLVLDATLVGTQEMAVIGDRPDGDVYLDGATTRMPVLYHDFATHWIDRIRRRLGKELATILESQAHADTFELLLQQDDDESIEHFLELRGIRSRDVEHVRGTLRLTSEAEDEAATRWWTAMLRSLGWDGVLPRGHEAEGANRVLHDIGWLEDEELGAVLMRAGGGRAVRGDTSPEGALAALERAGLDLADLDRELRELGDDGLSIDVAARALRRWSSEFGPMVCAALASTNRLDPDSAKAAPSSWRPPEALAMRIAIRPADVLQPVVADLSAVGIDVDAEALASDPVSALSQAIGCSPADLDARSRALYSPEELVRQRRESLSSWSKALLPVIVAARTDALTANHQLRAIVEEVRPQLAGLETFDDLRERLDSFVPSVHADLRQGLLRLLPRDSPLSRPDAHVLDATVEASLDQAHVARVRAVLSRGARVRADSLRAEVRALHDAGATIEPVVGLARGRERIGGTAERRRVPVVRVTKDQRKLDRFGRDAESRVLAAAVDVLWSMAPETRRRALDEMQGLLSHRFEDAAVTAALGYGREAADAQDEDDILEALASFMHLSAISDAFGADVLGYVRPAAECAPVPLLLEVKSTSDRRLLMSANEWDTAVRLGESYGIVAVLRDKRGAPGPMELILDPASLLDQNLIRRDADTWRISYTAGVR
jgi:hypothetical protein